MRTVKSYDRPTSRGSWAGPKKAKFSKLLFSKLIYILEIMHAYDIHEALCLNFKIHGPRVRSLNQGFKKISLHPMVLFKSLF